MDGVTEHQPQPDTDAGPVVVRQPTRLERLQRPLLTGGVVAGLTIALHFRDPHGSGSWGYCPFYALTGLYCPGCGGLRAVNDLTNGDLLAAASSNLVFVALVPLLVLAWLRWTGRAWTGRGWSGGASGTVAGGSATTRFGVRVETWIIVLALALLVFGVLRNLPVGSWLAP